jgi:large subunit ribosomal protein L9
MKTELLGRQAQGEACSPSTWLGLPLQHLPHKLARNLENKKVIRFDYYRTRIKMGRDRRFIALLLASTWWHVVAFTPPFGVSVLGKNCHQHLINTQSHRYPSLLLAKKKATAAPPAKLQVKLLKPVPGTGQKGDIVQVTPAFYQNKLQPARAAELISDEQVEKVRSLKQAHVKETNAQASSLQERLEAEDFQLVIRRKAGPDGQLFGGIGAKGLLTELLGVVKDDFLKSVKVKTILDADENLLQGDIKHTGIFSATLELTKEIIATIPVTVEAE